jgi:hypothetical protein
MFTCDVAFVIAVAELRAAFDGFSDLFNPFTHAVLNRDTITAGILGTGNVFQAGEGRLVIRQGEGSGGITHSKNMFIMDTISEFNITTFSSFSRRESSRLRPTLNGITATMTNFELIEAATEDEQLTVNPWMKL